MDKNQIDSDTYQFPPVSVYLAQSDANWLRLWAPDPRSLGAEAMGLAALRGLLAEDMPKDGQPLGGEVMHARALIDNARAYKLIDDYAPPPPPEPEPERTITRVYNILTGRGSELWEALHAHKRTIATLETWARDNIAALESRVVALECAPYAPKEAQP